MRLPRTVLGTVASATPVWFPHNLRPIIGVAHGIYVIEARTAVAETRRRADYCAVYSQKTPFAVWVSWLCGFHEVKNPRKEERIQHSANCLHHFSSALPNASGDRVEQCFEVASRKPIRYPNRNVLDFAHPERATDATRSMNPSDASSSVPSKQDASHHPHAVTAGTLIHLANRGLPSPRERRGASCHDHLRCKEVQYTYKKQVACY